MVKPTHRTGRCHCGAIRYEVETEPILSMVCHCSDCSRISGAVGHSAFAVPRDAVTVTGEITWYESPGELRQAAASVHAVGRGCSGFQKWRPS